MGANQSVRAGVEATSATIVGALCLFFGAWMLVMTGYLWTAVPVIFAGAVAFPPLRPIVTLGFLRVGRRFHDFITFLLWAALLYSAVLVARPWV